MPDYDTGVDSGHGTNILARIPDADYLDKIAEAAVKEHGTQKVLDAVSEGFIEPVAEGLTAIGEVISDLSDSSGLTNIVDLTGATTVLNGMTSWFTNAINAADEVQRNIKGNANGGLVDYTGLAWVDGTKAKPESFLDATDTELLRSMLDSFNFVKTTPYMSHVDSSKYGNTTVGDINITINEAEINSDADVDNLAKRVGQAFTKELQRNGLNLSGYAF